MYAAAQRPQSHNLFYFYFENKGLFYSFLFYIWIFNYIIYLNHLPWCVVILFQVVCQCVFWCVFVTVPCSEWRAENSLSQSESQYRFIADSISSVFRIASCVLSYINTCTGFYFVPQGLILKIHNSRGYTSELRLFINLRSKVMADGIKQECLLSHMASFTS